MSELQSIAIVAMVAGVLLLALIAVMLRRVVATNEVHIVQSRSATTSYGTSTGHGNTYYLWPSWVPLIGVTRIVLPVSVFDVTLQGYEAYDKGRVPFIVDVVAFFRISDSNMAAQRVANFAEMHDQLRAIVQGAIRSVLASHEIDSIMLERSKFGEQFTAEVRGQLKNWGVEAVKNIELMDIRDAQGNKVIHNIMEKKKSLIEMQSRTEVAENMKRAQIAEIDAKRDTDLQQQHARQDVGLRTVEADRAVQVANQQALQLVKEQERITKEKEMAVVQVADVQRAEIDKSVNLVKADQDKQTTILIAEGQLEAKRREAQGISAEGQARADAEKAMQLAPVEAQIVLAKEIGTNDGYQKYLITIRQVEAAQAVGIEQAKALEQAEVKVIANTGEPLKGITKVMELFSAKGGTEIGAMLEALAQTDEGKTLLGRIGANGASASPGS
jgi:flotillin